MSWCSRCIGIHGEGCPASYRDDAGRELCVFCYDDVVCPIQKRILAKAAAAGAPEIPTKPVVGAPTAENTRALAAVLLRRRQILGSTSTTKETTMTCSEPGCSKDLAHNNKTGRCQLHGGEGSHHPAAPVVRSERPRGNGHAGNGRANGNGHAHGNGHDLAVEARVELVLTKIPLEEKLAFISRWLSGEA